MIKSVLICVMNDFDFAALFDKLRSVSDYLVVGAILHPLNGFDVKDAVMFFKNKFPEMQFHFLCSSETQGAVNGATSY